MTHTPNPNPSDIALLFGPLSQIAEALKGIESQLKTLNEKADAITNGKK